MASGALPPGLPPIVIDGRHYWDGGIVSNSPLWYVLDDAPGLSALITQVDLFSARGPLPLNLDEVLERSKDIQYSSKTRFNTNRVKELEGVRAALGRLLGKLPPKFRKDPDVELLAPLCSRHRHITIMHLINRRMEHSSSNKDYLFSRGHGAAALGSRGRGRAPLLRASAMAQRDRDRRRHSGLRPRRLKRSVRRAGFFLQPSCFHRRST